jgi:hypothetical protein
MIDAIMIEIWSIHITALGQFKQGDYDQSKQTHNGQRVRRFQNKIGNLEATCTPDKNPFYFKQAKTISVVKVIVAFCSR